MERQRLAGNVTVFFMLLLCMLTLTTVKAQEPGPGVDPNVVMLDDFENGSTARWTPRPGVRGEKVTFELMDASNGDNVRFGNYALKVNIDFTDAQPNQTLTAQVSPGTAFDDLQIPGNAQGGKRLGMWVYATPEVEGMWFRIATRAIGASSGTTPSDLSTAIDWTGWKYVQCNLPAGHEFHPDGIRFLVLKDYTNYYVNGYVIIDNIRVTNQSFTEDLTPPTVTTLTGNGVDLSGTFTTSQIDLLATFNDPGTPSSGINHSSIRMLIDGYVFKEGDDGFTVNEEENSVSLTGITLSNGTHNVGAQVEDKFGHITTKTQTFTVEASDGKATTITTLSDAEVYVGSPFEMKINTNDSKDIKELELVFEMNNIGSVDEIDGVTFAPSAQEGSSYEFNPRNGALTINLKNDITGNETETLATIKINIPKNSNPTDVLRCSPVSARAVYADNSLSFFTLFDEFTKEVSATYNFIVNRRVVGAPGEVLVTDLNGNPQAGVTVHVLNAAMTESIESVITNGEGIASDMIFTNTAQSINIYAEKDGDYSHTVLVRTLEPLLTATPQYIRSGTTPDPTTSKTITWMTNPVQSEERAIMKLAKKSEGEDSFEEFNGVTKILEYNAVVSNGVTQGSSVTVENLEPGETYIYQVGDGTIWSPTREFTTTTVIDKFSFSAFGDLQATSNAGMGRFIAAARTIEEMPVKSFFNLNVGDVSDSDDRYDYYSYYGYLYDQCPVFGNIDMISGYGNHEYMGNPDADNIKFANGHHTVEPSDKYNAELVGTGSYAVEYGNMLVISLDWEHKGGVGTSTEILTEQAKWLEEILSKTDKLWKIVTMHYPIYPNAFTTGVQNILPPVFDKYNVQIMFCGHGHTFERVQVYEGEYLMPITDKRTFEPVIGGTLYFQLGDMTGTGSNGRWIHCDVDGNKMTVTVRNANNDIVENECFTLYAVNDYPVTFNTVDDNGTLTATVDGIEITSGDEVQGLKDVVFTATPNDGYRVKEWKVNDEVVNGTETIYTLSKLSEASTITVEFELDIPEYTVTFNTIDDNGTLTATVDGMEITTGTKLEKGKEVIFTATPKDAYHIKEWKLNGTVINGTETTYIITDLSENSTVTVEFEADINEYTVTFNVVGENGTLTATVDGTQITTGTQVAEGKNIIFTAIPDSEYSVKEWKLNGVVVHDVTTTYTLSNLTESVTVTVEFEDGSGVDNLSISDLDISPNPFIDVLHIKGAEDCILRVVDVTGKVLHIQKITSGNEVIYLEQLSSGIYLFQVEKNRQTKRVKVVKK